MRRGWRWLESLALSLASLAVCAALLEAGARLWVDLQARRQEHVMDPPISRYDPRLGWFHVHDWRHHWASWFMMNGGRETQLMELGGWADQRMIKRYVRLSIEHLREAVNLA